MNDSGGWGGRDASHTTPLVRDPPLTHFTPTSTHKPTHWPIHTHTPTPTIKVVITFSNSQEIIICLNLMFDCISVCAFVKGARGIYLSTKDGNTAAAPWTETRGTTDRLTDWVGDAEYFHTRFYRVLPYKYSCAFLSLIPDHATEAPPNAALDSDGNILRGSWEQRRLTGKLSSSGGTHSLPACLSACLLPFLLLP